MARTSRSLWHAVGYAAERARSVAGGDDSGPGARNGGETGDARGRPSFFASPVGRFAVATGTSLLVRTMERWLGRKAPGVPRLVRGAAAGVGAAGILAAVRHVMGRSDTAGMDVDVLDELLEGAGHGLVYAAIIEPHVPGPAVLRGLILGGTEHVLQPWGGVLAPLQGAAPHSKVPGLSRLFSPLDVGERPLFDHLLYATILAVLYGAGDRV